MLGRVRGQKGDQLANVLGGAGLSAGQRDVAGWEIDGELQSSSASVLSAISAVIAPGQIMFTLILSRAQLDREHLGQRDLALLAQCADAHELEKIQVTVRRGVYSERRLRVLATEQPGPFAGQL